MNDVNPDTKKVAATLAAGLLLAGSIAAYAGSCVSASGYTLDQTGGHCAISGIWPHYDYCTDDQGPTDGSCTGNQPSGSASCADETAYYLKDYAPSKPDDTSCADVTCTASPTGEVATGFIGVGTCPAG